MVSNRKLVLLFNSCGSASTIYVVLSCHPYVLNYFYFYSLFYNNMWQQRNAFFLNWCFSNFPVYQNHLENLLKHRLFSLAHRFSNSVSLEYVPKNFLQEFLQKKKKILTKHTINSKFVQENIFQIVNCDMLMNDEINLVAYIYHFLDEVGWKISEGILYLRLFIITQ